MLNQLLLHPPLTDSRFMKLVSKHTLSMCAVFAGLILILVGFLWPKAANIHWTDEQAQEFAEASAAQIKKAHERIYEARDEKETRAEALATQQRFNKIKAELELARQRPAEISLWLKIVGCAVALAGCAALTLGRRAV